MNARKEESQRVLEYRNGLKKELGKNAYAIYSTLVNYISRDSCKERMGIKAFKKLESKRNKIQSDKRKLKNS